MRPFETVFLQEDTICIFTNICSYDTMCSLLSVGLEREAVMAANEFIYDGTLEGILCLVLKCINMRVLPSHVYRSVRNDMADCDAVVIRTDPYLAGRLYRHIGSAVSFEAKQTVTDFFLTGLPDMERRLVTYICRSLRYGPCASGDYSDENIRRIHEAIRDLYRESHYQLEHLSFTGRGDLNTATILPRNVVIPVMRPAVLHMEEIDDFILYDKRHEIALVRRGDTAFAADISGLDMSAAGEGKDDRQQHYRHMWEYLSSGDHFTVNIRNRGRSVASDADGLRPPWYIAC